MDRTDHPPFTRITTVLLVAAPLLMAIGAVFLVRWNDQDWAGVLTDMAAHRTRSDLGWLLALTASGLLVVPGLALAGLVRESRPRTAAFATVTTALGWAGSAGICSGGVFMSAMAVSPARDAQIQVLTDTNKGASNVIYLLCVAGAVGMIALVVALAKSGAVPVGGGPGRPRRRRHAAGHARPGQAAARAHSAAARRRPSLGACRDPLSSAGSHPGSPHPLTTTEPTPGPRPGCRRAEQAQGLCCIAEPGVAVGAGSVASSVVWQASGCGRSAGHMASASSVNGVAGRSGGGASVATS